MGDLSRTLARELPGKAGERVCMQGWVHQIRKLGAVNFLQLRDRSGIAQLVLEPEAMKELQGLQVETVVRIEGTVEEEPRAALGVEVRDAAVWVISPVTQIVPFEIKKK